ncbi:MAG: PHB depolymerase family esterase [Kineosporiaceae bacterium]
MHRPHLTRRVAVGIATLALGAAAAVVAVPEAAHAATLQEITDFGDNPSHLRFFLYVPAKLQPKAPVLVVNHYCHGDATAMANGSQFDELAERYGYLAIYPQVTGRQDQCFDLASPGAIRHDGDTDPAGIRSMVAWTQAHYAVDPSRIFATGVSSGGMMTQELMGDYPDVFAAGAAFAGVPFGCFTIGTNIWSGWNSDCAQGKVTMSGRAWGDLVRAAYPGYQGRRPRLQLWHGVNDETVSYVTFGEAVKQWTDVLGLTAASSVDHPTSLDTRSVYRDATGAVLLETHSLAGTPHNLPVDAAAAIHFFGLDADPVPTSTAPTPTGTSPTPTATTPRPTTTRPTTAKKTTTKKRTSRKRTSTKARSCKNPRKCTRS